MKKMGHVWVFIITTLVIIRILLPWVLLPVVQNRINQIPQYRVKIGSLDVHLYRGAYTLRDIELWKSRKKIPVPFFSANKVDFSVEWMALLHGHIVAKIVISMPHLNFVTDPEGKNEQLTISKEWLDVVKSLFPLNINRLEIHNGKISFISYKGSPPFKVQIHDTDLIIKNMQKAEDANKFLSSDFMFRSYTEGNGRLCITGRFDPFKKLPLFGLKATLTDLKIGDLRHFLHHYTDVDIIGGNFSLYGELAAAKGCITGYVKPFIKNMKIGEPHGGPLNALADGVAKVAAEILENRHQKTIATRINIFGSVDDPDTNTLSIVGYLLRHAFIQALLPGIDKTVKPQDIIYGKKNYVPPAFNP